jgi:hypothetical protein
LIDNLLKRRIHLVSFHSASVLLVDSDHTFKPRVTASHTSPFIRSISPLYHPYRQILQSLVISDLCVHKYRLLPDGGRGIAAHNRATGSPAMVSGFKPATAGVSKHTASCHICVMNYPRSMGAPGPHLPLLPSSTVFPPFSFWTIVLRSLDATV